MSSTPLSEESTLLPSSPTRPTLHEINRDVPVKVQAFHRNVRRCKALLGPALAVALGLEICHVVFQQSERVNKQWSLLEKRFFASEQYGDYAGTALMVVVVAVYLGSILKPVKTPQRYEGTFKNLSLHRYLCLTTFFTTLFLLLLHSLPGVLYTVATYHGPPTLHPTATWLGPARTVSLMVTLTIAGCMRRGPRSHFTPLKFGLGFGVFEDEAPAKTAQDGTAKDDAYGDESDESDNVLDYSNSALLDFIFLSYMAPLARRSLAVPRLLQADIPHLEEFIRRAGDGHGTFAMTDHQSGINSKVTNWELVRAVWKGRGTTVFITLLIETMVTCVSYLQAISVHEIIDSFEDPKKSDMSYRYLMCWGLFAGQTLECILSAGACVRENYLLHMPVKMTLASMLFGKILRSAEAHGVEAHHLSEEDVKKGKGRSQIMNLLTIDVGTVASIATQVWNVTNSIISLTIGTVFLYQMFGVSAFIGLACVPLSAPISYWVARMSYRCDRAWARATDARVGAIKEFLLGYKVIKLNAFEPYFRGRIDHLRSTEVVWQRWRYTLGTLYNILADQLPTFAIFVTFFFYTKVFGHQLVPATAFVAITVFERVKSSLQFLPQVMQSIFNTIVAINRLTIFLNQTEIDLSQWESTSNAIVFSNATIGWPTVDGEEVDSKRFRLEELDFELPTSKFILVCGPLGSGKTLFLRALLGEAVVEKGYLMAPRSSQSSTPLNGNSIPGPWSLSTWLDDSVCYAPQQAYIRHGTIRDNILFGQPMWRSRYHEALRQASLVSDLALMSDGDKTEVGDHGVNLSGGQKARINLARCIYSRARTVYMDDILSAVDAHTAQFIFRECLQGSLLRGRTVVMVTHHVGLCLPGADFVVALRYGKVEEACAANESHVDTTIEPPQEEELLSPPPTATAKRLEGEPQARQAEDQPSPRRIYQAEKTSEGRVNTSHFMMVFSAAGGAFYWTVLALIFGSTTSFDLARNIFLRHWSTDPSPAHLDKNLLIYLSIVTGAILMGALRWVWLYGVGPVGFYNRGSRKIHATLLDRICGAPLSFFESTPMGRLMNIFGQDVRRLDAYVADDFGRTLMAALSVGTAALAVCFQAPALLAFLVIFGIPLYWLSGALGKLRADIRRLTAVAGSPLITLYNDAIQGIVMVRAFGSSDLMTALMQTFINRERQAWSADWQIYNWVKSMIKAMSSIFVTATGFMLVRRQDLSGAEIGLILSFAVTASSGLFNLLECYSNLELTFVSAERVNHYVKMEAHESTEGLLPEKGWPHRGRVSFKDVSIRYAKDLPEVLSNVSFDVEASARLAGPDYLADPVHQPGMRVGLVGSTGSGKSTLALALFRAMSPHHGSIEIDGIDIGTVEMHELRQKLNMVVQDGSLCSGSLRNALDITGEKDDHEIYEALRRVHLLPDHVDEATVLENPFADLDTFVAVEGANFSQGQRQLLCLARALLKQSKILVMDEATSSVDFEMDAKITATIKECFAGTTMIVIAHRLATIMHFDRILVLNKGKVLEYGRPMDLVKDKSSAFYDLCMAQGQEEFDKLTSLAQS